MFTKSVSADRGLVGQPRQFGSRGRLTSRRSYGTGGGATVTAVSQAVSALRAAGRNGLIPAHYTDNNWLRDRNRQQPWVYPQDLEQQVQWVDDLTGAPRGWQLGPELVTDSPLNSGMSSFTNNSSGTGTAVGSAGQITVTGTDASNRGWFTQQISTVAGRLYRVTIVASRVSGSLNYVWGANATDSFSGPTASGPWSTYVTAAGSSTRVGVQTAAGGAQWVIDSISVQEVILDTSWLGPNLVTNGDFSNGTTGWALENTSTGAREITVTGGAIRLLVTDNSTGFLTLRQQCLQANKAYAISFTVVSIAGTLRVRTVTTSTGTVDFTTPGPKWIALGSESETSIRFSSAGNVDTIIDNITVREIPGNPLVSPSAGNGPTATARVNLLQQTNTVSTARTATTVAATYRIYVGTGSVTLSGTATGTFSAGTATFSATAGTLTVTPSGTATNVDVRLAVWDSLNLPAYQRVGDGSAGVFDYDHVGFPVRLVRGAANRGLMTLGTLGMTATDAIHAGMWALKTSDSAAAALMEMSSNSNSNTGVAVLYAPHANGSAAFTFGSKGSLPALTARAIGSATAPAIGALLGTGRISTDISTLFVNGVQAASVTDDQGTGNYGNHRLHQGGRSLDSSPSLSFSGEWLPGFVVDANAVDSTLAAAMLREISARVGHTY